MKNHPAGTKSTTETSEVLRSPAHLACMASHFRISCHACSLLLLWILMMLVMSGAARSSSRQRHLQDTTTSAHAQPAETSWARRSSEKVPDHSTDLIMRRQLRRLWNQGLGQVLGPGAGVV